MKEPAAKIAVIEDDKMLAEIYKTRIELAGYKCLIAGDGAAGLQLLEAEKPDLVILDLMLPELSGEEVLRRMRQESWGKDMKVIIATNVSETEGSPELQSLGFERYIVKANMSHNDLVDIIAEVLGKRSAPGQARAA